MRDFQSRKHNRIATEMMLRSVSLPAYSAELTDISERGARLKLKARKAPKELVENRIRFGVSLPNQMSTQFEGFARVAWVRESKDGVEAGLEWEKLSAADWARAIGVLQLSA